MPPSSKLARLKLLYNTFLCGRDTEVDGPTQVWHVFAETSPSPACYNVDETKYSEEHLGCIFGPGIFFDMFCAKNTKARVHICEYVEPKSTTSKSLNSSVTV